MWSCGNTSLLVVASESYRAGATALMPIVWTQGSPGGPTASASARKTEVGHGVCWEDGEIHRHHHCHWPDLLLPTDGCAGVKHLEHAENNGRRKGGRKALEAHRHRHRWPQNIKKNPDRMGPLTGRTDQAGQIATQILSGARPIQPYRTSWIAGLRRPFPKTTPGLSIPGRSGC
jgi:hypothetical protein